jgi:DNA-binding CsgD family transcriptional regulator
VELARAFGLTPAEARLASRLVDEDSVETAADKLGVTYETARKTLKSIFAKTNTHRQAQLVALAARFAKPNREQGR